MKGQPLRILVLVAAAVLVVVLGRTVNQQYWAYDNQSVTLSRGGAWAGFDRLMGQISWMRLMQYRSAAARQEPSEALARSLANRYENVTNLDPFMTMAYKHGGLELATMQHPEMGLELIDRGIDVLGTRDSQLPIFAAHIASHYLKDDQRALGYLEMAQQDGDHPISVESAIVRLRAKEAGGGPVTVARLWHELCTADHHHQDMAHDEADGSDDRSRLAQGRQRVADLMRELRDQANDLQGQPREEKLAQAMAVEKVLLQMTRFDPATHEGVRLSAAVALATLDPESPRANKTLADLVNGGSPESRIEASQAVVRLNVAGPARDAAIAYLIEALGDTSAKTRQAAAEALGQLGPAAAPATDRLVDLLRDEEARVVAASAAALGRVGAQDPAAAAALEELLGRKPVRRPMASDDTK